MAAASLPAELSVLPGKLAVETQTKSINPQDQLQVSAQLDSSPERTVCSLGGKYPEEIVKWCSLIETYATKNGLTANLLAAVILQESGGNPQAYSSDGAVGLMQVMSRDGLAASFNCPAGPCFARRPSMDQLFDPEFNIAYGSEMLAGLIQKYKSTREGLKYYGPSGVGYHYADTVLAIFMNYQ